MCGIAGSFSYDVNKAVDMGFLHEISTHMQTRGPDGEGVWQHNDCSIAFVHRRLAVIDLSPSATQPMQDQSGRYVISYNGEIYNYLDLRQHCEEKGYQFATQSDTEVLLALYQFYDIEMLSQIRGMFAFAICDTHEQTVLLARDPHGIKPLYYVDYEFDGVEQCFFASSLQALQHAGLVDKSKVDIKAVAGFQHTGSVPEPLTWFQKSKLLPAGSYRILRREKRDEVQSDIKQYWNLTSCTSLAKTKNNVESDYKHTIREAVTESVQAHMIADVPIGLFLSAGIDSSVLATLMRQCTDQPIQAITLRFSEYQDTNDDESILAAEIARRHGLEHHVYTLEKEEFIEELPRFFATMEQPTIDGLNTWFVAKAAKKLGLKVVMSGVGGDELFGGYPSFSSIPRLLSGWSILSPLFKLPFILPLYRKIVSLSGVRSAVKWSLLPEYAESIVSAYRLQRGIFLSPELTQELQSALVELETTLDLSNLTIKNADTSCNVGLLESQCYMRNQLLRDTDWASMAHSIEVRTPLVDKKLSESLAPIPSATLYQSGKLSLAQLLSDEDYHLLSQREKTGFTLPMQEWLSELELDHAHDSHWSRAYVKHVIARFGGYQ